MGPLRHYPPSVRLSRDIFQDVSVKPEPGTDGDGIINKNHSPGMVDVEDGAYQKENSPTCIVVLIANGSWLSGVFKMLIIAMETNTFCASKTFLSSRVT